MSFQIAKTPAVTAISRVFFVATLFATLPISAMAAVEIDLQHQLDAAQAERLGHLVEDFNNKQKDYRIKLVAQAVGGGTAVLNLATPSTVLRISGMTGKYRPLYKVMAETKSRFDASAIAADLRVRTSDEKGNLLALPVGMVAPVLYYNKAAFKKAGLDPNRPPQTWEETQEYAGKLRSIGMQCPYTTSWLSWVHIDNLSSLNAAEIATPKGSLDFNGLVQVKHIARLATWYKADYFKYYGRRDEADKHFLSGECGMLTSSSSLTATLRDSAGLDVGIAPLPYYDDVQGAPKHTLADGFSLWIGERKKPAEYKAAAAFVNYLLTPEMQIELTQMGAYLPMTSASRAAANSKLLGPDLAGLQVAMTQLKGAGSTYPVRVSQVDSLRIVVDEELEAVWAGKKPAKEALDTAVSRGNLVMSNRGGAAAGSKKTATKK